MYNYNERREELIELAFIDNSAPYEVDETGIYTDGDIFYILSASGCSCWDGDYDEERFNDFESVKRFLLGEDLPRYNPTIKGAMQLIEEAERKLGLTSQLSPYGAVFTTRKDCWRHVLDIQE